MSKIIYDISGQIQGVFDSTQDLLSNLETNHFKQIGFETNKDNILIINDKEIKIGITNRIEYSDIEIQSCRLATPGFLIITYIYEKEI